MLELKEDFVEILTERFQFEDFATYVTIIMARHEKQEDCNAIKATLSLLTDYPGAINLKIDDSPPNANILRFLSEWNSHSNDYHNADHKKGGIL